MTEMKKVVHVLRRIVPEKWGGTERVVFHLAEAFNRMEIENTLFSTDMFMPSGEELYRGVRIRRFRYLFPWLGLSQEEVKQLRLKGGSPLSLPLFFALLREKEVSIIHTHVLHRLGGMARTAARLKHIPYVVTIHGGYLTLPADQVDQMRAPFRGKLEWGKLFGWMLGSRRVLRDADAILCVGMNEYRAMGRRYPDRKVFHLPNGVDAQWFAHGDAAAFRAAFGYEEREKIVLCVSRIDYQKNQLDLVRAFERFTGTHPDHRLVLIGAVAVSAYHTELMEEVEQRGLQDKVRIIPGLRPDDPMLCHAYKAAEFFVLASRYEPFGIVVLEAWASGTPVLATAVGGIPGFCTDRENALLVPNEDVDAMASAMAELADHPEQRDQLAASGRREVSAYDWSSIALRLKEIYTQILPD